MCGILGSLSFQSDPILFSLAPIKHRGPDGEGIVNDGPLSMGHVRLSILDLETGDQPLFSHDQRFVLIHNGEIYNYQIIKEELQQKGINFKSQSDSESIVQLFSIKKEQSFKELDGMFSVAIWDKIEKTLYLARDPLGIKPLYYFQNHKGFYFSSEIKGLMQFLPSNKVNESALSDYFLFGYTAPGTTIYDSIKEVLPGQWISIKPNQKFQTQHFSSLTPHPQEQPQNPDPFLLTQGIQKRLQSHVPFGLFLSGGLDSAFLLSAMTSLLKSSISTFNIGFKHKYFDESPLAQETSDYFQSHLKTHTFTQEDLLDQVGTTLLHMDQPHSDPAILPTFILSQLASKDVKMVLSGEGGDELFFGYQRYQALVGSQFLSYLSKPLSTLPLWDSNHDQQIIRLLSKTIQSSSASQGSLAYLPWICHNQALFEALSSKQSIHSLFETSKLFQNLKESFEGTSLVEGARRFDLKNYIPGQLLKKVDMMSMYHGLEVRVPFLDKKLMSNILSSSLKSQYRFFTPKYLLKNWSKTILPQEITKRKKHGFTLPLDIWFKEKLAKEFETFVLEESQLLFTIFDPQKIKQMFQQHKSGKRRLGQTLWNLFVFAYWEKHKL